MHVNLCFWRQKSPWHHENQQHDLGSASQYGEEYSRRWLTQHLMGGWPAGSHVKDQHQSTIKKAIKPFPHQIPSLLEPCLMSLGAWGNRAYNFSKLGNTINNCFGRRAIIQTLRTMDTLISSSSKSSSPSSSPTASSSCERSTFAVTVSWYAVDFPAAFLPSVLVMAPTPSKSYPRFSVLYSSKTKLVPLAQQDVPCEACTEGVSSLQRSWCSCPSIALQYAEP